MEQIELRSGRRVGLHRLSGGARTVVLCHAAPGAGNFDPDPAQTSARDISLIAVDRPGYGGSQPPGAGEWATVAAAADDLAQVLDGLQTGPVGVAGWSAGGRVALALAARRPDLVDRVAVISTPAPDAEVSWIPPEHRAGLEALSRLPPDQVHAALTDQFSALKPADPNSDAALALLGRGPQDDAALAYPGARTRLGGMMTAAWTQGAAGMAADVAGYGLRPWGFEPLEVRAKTLLLYGAKDPIGSKHAAWWKKALPGARLEMVPGAGHLLIIPMWRRVLSHLAPGSRA